MLLGSPGMDAVEVIDLEEGSRGHRTMENGRRTEPSGSRDKVAVAGSASQRDIGIPEPQVGMGFDSDDDAKRYYNEYAKRVGFSIKSSLFKQDWSGTSREFVCSKEDTKRRTDGCEAMLRVEFKGNKWIVTKFVKEHKHQIVGLEKMNQVTPPRHIGGAAKNSIGMFQTAGSIPSGFMYPSMDRNHTSVQDNRAAVSVSPADLAARVRNTVPTYHVFRPAMHKKTFGKDGQNMLDYFKKMQAEDPGFFYAIQLDEDNCMANAFWADARSRTAYSHFGDVVTLDTSYRVNQCKVPYVPFSGMNHHGQAILFGCALLLDDSEASFLWLFRTFLTAMNDHAPVSIVTDQDRAIQTAIHQVFPKARHCISRWHVLREGQERLGNVSLAHPNFQTELYNCINLTETIEEFESCWASIMDKYDLRINDWLQSLYNRRTQWVPVYFRDSFFGAISLDQCGDSSIFDGLVNQQTNLPVFFRQYERAMESWFGKEVESDFDTENTTPVLRTPSPMEKQAANFYTKKIFAKFQEELVETFVYTANKVDGDGPTSMFRVAKFEDNNKAYIVTLNLADVKASCSCQMFEYAGILCRHILTVFTVTNVLTLPSYYILKRWTKNAKSVVTSLEHGTDQECESMALRYKNLCREAIRFSEDGAIALETYNAAVAALQEAGMKVASLKRNVGIVAAPNSQVAGGGHGNTKDSAGGADMNPLLWPRQDEVTQRFNLNDSTAAPQSSADNLPRMGPLFLQRDGGTSDNAVMFPCMRTMTWSMENKNSTNRVAVINLKLQDYTKTPAAESEVRFQLSKVTLEPMLRSMSYISEQLLTPANRVAVINLKLQDTETISGESEVKFQVSKETLGAMMRSMAYIREQLSNPTEPPSEPLSKKLRK